MPAAGTDPGAVAGEGKGGEEQGPALLQAATPTCSTCRGASAGSSSSCCCSCRGATAATTPPLTSSWGRGGEEQGPALLPAATPT
jgi:hypothetical protein